jgi:hypothetical protein
MSTDISPSAKVHKKFSKACYENDFDTVKTMVEAGIDLTQPWEYEKYPLNGVTDIQICKYLLEHGMPVFSNLKEHYEYVDINEISEYFTFSGYWEEKIDFSLELLMLDYSNKVNTTNISFIPFTPLTELNNGFESKQGNEFLDKIILKGADVDFKTSGGETALHFIVSGNNDYYMDLLVRHSKKIDIAPDDFKLNTPLYASLEHRNFKISKLLLELGADINTYDFDEELSILDCVFQMKKNTKAPKFKADYQQMIDYLISIGAKTYQQMLDNGDIEES